MFNCSVFTCYASVACRMSCTAMRCCVVNRSGFASCGTRSMLVDNARIRPHAGLVCARGAPATISNRLRCYLAGVEVDGIPRGALGWDVRGWSAFPTRPCPKPLAGAASWSLCVIPPAKACCACQLLQQCKRYRRGPLGIAGQAAGALGRTSPRLVGRGYPTRSAIGAGWRGG